jgi:hypothetical protein
MIFWKDPCLEKDRDDAAVMQSAPWNEQAQLQRIPTLPVSFVSICPRT